MARTRAAGRGRLQGATALAVGLATVAVGAAGTVHAQEEELLIDEPPPREVGLPEQPPLQLAYVNSTAGRINPGGVVNLFDAVLRVRLFEPTDLAFRQTFVSVGLSTALAPAFGRVGAVANIQPVSFLQLYVRYWFVGFYGNLNLMASFPSATDDFSDQAIEERANQPGTRSYATTGGELVLGLLVRPIRIGPIAVRNHFLAVYSHHDLRDGDNVFYEQVYDLLMPNDGWALVNDLDVLVPTRFGLTLGARWGYARPFYRSRHLGPAGRPPSAPDNDLHKLGPLVSYRFHHRPGSRFESPTVVLFTLWYLKHRFRTGVETSQAVPLVSLGFQFRGDLLSSD